MQFKLRQVVTQGSQVAQQFVFAPGVQARNHLPLLTRSSFITLKCTFSRRQKLVKCVVHTLERSLLDSLIASRMCLDQHQLISRQGQRSACESGG